MTAPYGIRDVATCGTCDRSWDYALHPTPATLCPFCNGDEDAAEMHELVNEDNVWEPADSGLSFTPDEVEDIVRAFIGSTMWTATLWIDGDGEPADGVVDVDDMPAKLREDLRAHAVDFVSMVTDTLTIGTLRHYLDAVHNDVSRIGHDLALTREGHGAGFWDRGAGIAGDRLTNLAEAMSGEGLHLEPALESGVTRSPYISAGYFWDWS